MTRETKVVAHWQIIFVRNQVRDGVLKLELLPIVAPEANGGFTTRRQLSVSVRGHSSRRHIRQE